MEDKLLNELLETEISVIYSELADMILDKALHDFRREQLQREIDQSLKDLNKEEFLRLTEELKSMP